jgi:transcriptional regulator with XRE-family HTH domain
LTDEKISRKIKALRKTRGLTQEQLAEKLGVQRATVSNYEIGRRSPHIKELERIASALGVSLEYFGVGGNEVHDLIARAQMVFENPDIDPQEKANVYKEIMRLYLKMEE